MKSVLFLTFTINVIFAVNAQPTNNIFIDKDIQLNHLKDSIFIHVTWDETENYGRFSSNGLILIKNGQALMVDTPMDNKKTERLTKFLKDSLSVKLTKFIAGHFHSDCIGGLEYLNRLGIESVANSMTVEKCRELDLPVPSSAFIDSLIFDFQGQKIECCYFGAGHSFDNITVWIHGENILFGGCLIKSMNSRGLGNLADAVVPDWDFTIEKIIKKYPNAEIIIPGHGSAGGPDLLTHTIELVKKEKLNR